MTTLPAIPPTRRPRRHDDHDGEDTMRTRSWRRTGAATLAVAALLLAACDDDEPVQDEVGGVESGDETGGDVDEAVGEELSVSEALDRGEASRVTVTGLLLDAEGEVRLCESVLESYPPQCGEPSLTVQGVRVPDLDGAQVEGEITWVDQAAVTGELTGDVLTATGDTD
jgi:hypothetical protein